LNINIDKSLNISIYEQIVSQIEQAVDNGLLVPGERLPTQRDLSVGLNIARGTIQKAYEELEKKGVVEIVKGSGSFIAKGQLAAQGDRKQRAVCLIDELIAKLDGLDFTSREARALIDIRMLERENHHVNVRVAVIDCNPEALEIFKVQFSHMKHIEFRMFNLDEVLKYSQPEKIFEDYDIIITTINHYDQISGILYPIRNKLFKVAVSPARDTIIKIANIAQISQIGIIVKSNNFKNIILRHLKTFDIEKERVEHVFDTDLNSISNLLQGKDILIIPQCFRFHNATLKEQLQHFVKRGGMVIEFKYQIERGSLIYIEEQIGHILRTR
jgi:DNA-binding transcriptional regulator YhcF (GntR family)